MMPVKAAGAFERYLEKTGDDLLGISSGNPFHVRAKAVGNQ
jgi:hypothetical protein